MPKTREERLAVKKAWREANRDKTREYSRRYHKKHREIETERHREWIKKNPEWTKNWVANNPEKVKNAREKWLAQPGNKEKQAKASLRWRKSARGKRWIAEQHILRFSEPHHRWYRSLVHAQKRAALKNLEFEDALFEHIHNLNPTHCACCNVEIDYGAKGSTLRERHRAVSIDRVDNTKGYTIANVSVICFRCNKLKSDATLDELRKIVAYIEKFNV